MSSSDRCPIKTSKETFYVYIIIRIYCYVNMFWKFLSIACFLGGFLISLFLVEFCLLVMATKIIHFIKNILIWFCII